MCGVLCDALASMLRERDKQDGVPTGQHQRQTGHSTSEPEAIVDESLQAPGTVATGEQERDGNREGSVLPEDRKEAVEILRAGEKEILRLCLEYTEVEQKSPLASNILPTGSLSSAPASAQAAHSCRFMTGQHPIEQM